LVVVAGRLHSGSVPLADFAMGGFALLACLSGLLCVVPCITRGRSCGADATNPVFFGDFDRISAGEYLGKIAGIMEEDCTLYRAHVLDLYNLGQVLQRKYRYLRYGYHILAAAISSPGITSENTPFPPWANW
jgi:hypothetical protein